MIRSCRTRGTKNDSVQETKRSMLRSLSYASPRRYTRCNSPNSHKNEEKSASCGKIKSLARVFLVKPRSISLTCMESKMNRPLTSSDNTSPVPHHRKRATGSHHDVPPSAPLSPGRIEGSPRRQAPSDEKSYLKSRRAQARNTRRSNIMNMLDRNVFDLSTDVPTSESSIAKHYHGSMNSTGTSNTAKTTETTATNCTEMSSPAESPVPVKEPATRRLFNMFRKESSSHSRSISPSVLRRSQSPGALSRRSSRQEQERLHQEQLIQVVLERYPKRKCRTFSDHKDLAMAELTQHCSAMYMTPKKVTQLKVMLEEKLREILDEHESIAESHVMVPEKKKSKEEGRSRSNSTGGLPRRKNSSNKAQRSDGDKTEHIRNTINGEAPLFVTKKTRSQSMEGMDDACHPGSSKAMEVPAQSPVPRKSSLPQTESRLLPPLKPTKQEVCDLMLLDTSGNIGKYTGMISVKTGKPHGFGKMIYQSDSVDKGVSYEGNWNQGQWNGKGRLVKHNGDIYEGHFCDDQKHGNGVFYYSDGKRHFDGRYVMGHRTEGTMFYSDKSVYKGQWYNGKRHGRGTYQFSDKSIYKGEFVCDRIHGAGQLTWPDGSKYVGEWSQGHRHGMGKEYDKEGNVRYHGMWKNNKPLKDTDS